MNTKIYPWLIKEIVLGFIKQNALERFQNRVNKEKTSEMLWFDPAHVAMRLGCGLTTQDVEKVFEELVRQAELVKEYDYICAKTDMFLHSSKKPKEKRRCEYCNKTHYLDTEKLTREIVYYRKVTVEDDRRTI